MSNGRIFYLPKDVGWWRRENIVLLADEVGPIGPAVVDWLFCEAGAQRAAFARAERADYDGTVKSGVNAVKRGIGAGDVDDVREALRRAAEVGALDDLQWLDDRRFTCRISGWRSDVHDVLTRENARQRKQQQRARERHATSRDVTPGHTEKERERKKERETTKDLVEHGSTTGAENELFAYWQQRCDHPKAKFGNDRRAKVRARLREGYTPEQIRQAIDGAAVDPTEKDGRVYDDLELICRNGSKLESFMRRTQPRAPRPTSGMSKAERRSARVQQLLAEADELEAAQREDAS